MAGDFKESRNGIIWPSKTGWFAADIFTSLIMLSLVYAFFALYFSALFFFCLVDHENRLIFVSKQIGNEGIKEPYGTHYLFSSKTIGTLI